MPAEHTKALELAKETRDSQAIAIGRDLVLPVCEAYIEVREPVEPIHCARHRIQCGSCHFAVASNWKHCAECGRPIIWE